MEVQPVFCALEDKNIHLVILNLNDNDLSVFKKAINRLNELPEEDYLLHEVAYILNKIIRDLTFSVDIKAEK